MVPVTLQKITRSATFATSVSTNTDVCRYGSESSLYLGLYLVQVIWTLTFKDMSLVPRQRRIRYYRIITQNSTILKLKIEIIWETILGRKNLLV